MCSCQEEESRVFIVSREFGLNDLQEIKPGDLDLIRQIDQQYLEHPSFGSLSMRRFLEKKGNKINRKRVQRLVRQMGIEAIYPKPRTSIPNPEHKVYPYLLREWTSPSRIKCGQQIYICSNETGFYVSRGRHGLA